MFRISSIVTGAALTLSLLATVLGSAAAAQSQSATVRIPFDFSANNQRLPAGKYRISVAGRYLSLLDTKTSRDLYLMVLPASTKNSQTQGRLLFRRYGQTNYLGQVWMPNQGEGREFIHSRAEQETQRAIDSASVAQVQIPLQPAKP